MTNFSIQPPTSLSLDVDRDGDLDIVRQGTFNVTEATAYYIAEDGYTISSESIIDSTVSPISIAATIGSGNQINLFSYPKETEVLRVVGFFDPIAVDDRTGDGGAGDVARFDLLIGEYGRGIDESTIYLPKFVSFAGYQITDLGTSKAIGDNNNVFSEIRPVLAMSPYATELKGLDVVKLDNGIDQWYVGYTPQSSGAFALHGTIRGLGGGGFGDPHMITFDGLEYDFHAAGEFTLVESIKDDFEVQVRAEHINDETTYYTAAATEVDGTRVAFYANEQESLLIGGEATELASGEFIQVGDGLITRDQDTYIVTYDNSDSSSDPEQLLITLKERKNSGDFYLNVKTFLADYRKGSVAGLLGNNNSTQDDDLALQDGTVLGTPINFNDFYTNFADGWRIDQEESLFDYGEGEDTSTYTETNFFDNNNVIIGLDGADIISGGAGNDRINGRGGADLLSGDSGADRLSGGWGMDTFTYKNFQDSTLDNFDTITDFNIGTDKIKGVYEVNTSQVAQLAAVETLDEAGIQAVLTEGNFVSKGGATFAYGAQTFLALNDQVAGYSAADDALIEITGFEGSLADLAIDIVC